VDYGTTRRKLQAHAVRLELDVGHLPPFKPVAPRHVHDPKPVDDVLLESAVRESRSWADVLRRLGIKQSGSAQVRIHAEADKLGLDASHFRGQAWGSTPVSLVEMPFTRQRDPKYLPYAASAFATAWFMERGYRVSVPTEPAPYDMVVESDEGFVRVQVKSTNSQDRPGYYIVNIHRRSYRGSGSRSRCAYTSDEIDVFFIVTASGDRYLIPLAVTGALSSLILDTKYAQFKV
jgi:hypothetical protein